MSAKSIGFNVCAVELSTIAIVMKKISMILRMISVNMPAGNVYQLCKVGY